MTATRKRVSTSATTLGHGRQLRQGLSTTFLNRPLRSAPFLVHVGELEGKNALSRHHDEIDPLRDETGRWKSPEALAAEPLHPVSLDRVSHFLRDDEPDARRRRGRQRARRYQKMEMASRDPARAVLNAYEVRSTPNPARSAERCLRNRPPTSGRRRLRGACVPCACGSEGLSGRPWSPCGHGTRGFECGECCGADRCVS